MPNSASSAFPISEWSADHLRLTLFPSDPVGDATDWWKLVGGSDPLTVVNTPRTGGSKASGPVSVKGISPETDLTLTVERGRVEWRLSVKQMPLLLPDLLGPFVDVTEPFLKILEAWFDAAPPVKRLAFGAVCLHQVPSKEAGYNELDAFLSAVKVESGARDFLYQINRPIKSEVSELEINRLMKWNVQHAQFLSVDASGVTETSEWLGTRLELDINTDAANTNPFSAKTMLDELRQHAFAIAEKGDLA